MGAPWRGELEHLELVRDLAFSSGTFHLCLEWGVGRDGQCRLLSVAFTISCLLPRAHGSATDPSSPEVSFAAAHTEG